MLGNGRFHMPIRVEMHFKVTRLVRDIGVNLHFDFLEEPMGAAVLTALAIRIFVKDTSTGLPADGYFPGTCP